MVSCENISKYKTWGMMKELKTKLTVKKGKGLSTDFDQKNLPRLFSGQSFCLIIQRARVQNPAEAECFSLILRDLNMTPVIGMCKASHIQTTLTYECFYEPFSFFL
uniref:Uncharacterized protein n=1 Tax=Cacopsylla melanoneura TaxID=428564 RepID=A0A8D8RCC9_9HEMI